MPIQNGKYINPGWTDNSPPAIDASELNAISDTLQNLDANGTGYTAGNGISIIGQQISAKLSSQSDNSAIFGSDGGIYVPTQGGGGKRYATFVIGTSTAGWTQSDCDYLCDGTDDDVEFNEAISNFPQIGGEIVVLPGQYNISNTINMSGITSAPPGKIRGIGSWSRSIHFVWTGEYTSESVSGSVSSNEKYAIFGIWNGSVSNVWIDMGSSSQASGNVGIVLGSLGVCENCYFSNTPTALKSSTYSFTRGCYFSGDNGQSYGIYATGGTIIGNFIASGGIQTPIYCGGSRYAPCVVSLNTMEQTGGSGSGIVCTGAATATLISNNILVNRTISDQTTTYHPTIVNNIEC